MTTCPHLCKVPSSLMDQGQIYEVKKFKGPTDTFVKYKVTTLFITFFTQDLYLFIGNIKTCTYTINNNEVTAYIHLYKCKSINWMKDNILYHATYTGIRINRTPRTLIRINEDNQVIYLE